MFHPVVVWMGVQQFFLFGGTVLLVVAGVWLVWVLFKTHRAC